MPAFNKQVQTPFLEPDQARQLLFGIRRRETTPTTGTMPKATQRDERGGEGRAPSSPEVVPPALPARSAPSPAAFDATRLAVGPQLRVQPFGRRQGGRRAASTRGTG